MMLNCYYCFIIIITSLFFVLQGVSSQSKDGHLNSSC